MENTESSMLKKVKINFFFCSKLLLICFPSGTRQPASNVVSGGGGRWVMFRKTLQQETARVHDSMKKEEEEENCTFYLFHLNPDWSGVQWQSVVMIWFPVHFLWLISDTQKQAPPLEIQSSCTMFYFGDWETLEQAAPQSLKLKLVAYSTF